MNTPVNGPRIENGNETTSVAIAKPRIVFCSSGLNTIEEMSTAWNRPSPDCVISRIANSPRKSSLRSASRARCRVDFTPRMVGARPPLGGYLRRNGTIAPKSSSPDPAAIASSHRAAAASVTVRSTPPRSASSNTSARSLRASASRK